MSPVVPAECTHCGHTWNPAHGIQLEGGAQLTLGSGTLPCENCGKPARFAAGTVRAHGDDLVFVEGPQWSQSLVERMRVALEQVADKSTPDPVQTVAAVDERVALELQRVADALERAHPKTTRRTLMAKAARYVLATVFTATVGASAGVVANRIDDAISDEQQAPNWSPEQLRREVHRQLREVQRTGRTSVPRTPPSRAD